MATASSPRSRRGRLIAALLVWAVILSCALALSGSVGAASIGRSLPWPDEEDRLLAPFRWEPKAIARV